MLRRGGAKNQMKKIVLIPVEISQFVLIADVTTLFVKRLKPKHRVTNILEVLS